ncbi:hypothetical protein PoB_000221200 [Plakobranchus ocellatus]|uniref:Uncharacterized protein n=1 Tax=Plakobranchus ocellatus TaxID=259542 RepID=A0AAV3XYZ9_9GAST|nr:hypothetical protein PoB_000221200 [Plakobranchus ocellatus]
MVLVHLAPYTEMVRTRTALFIQQFIFEQSTVQVLPRLALSSNLNPIKPMGLLTEGTRAKTINIEAMQCEDLFCRVLGVSEIRQGLKTQGKEELDRRRIQDWPFRCYVVHRAETSGDRVRTGWSRLSVTRIAIQVTGVAAESCHCQADSIWSALGLTPVVSSRAGCRVDIAESMHGTRVVIWSVRDCGKPLNS